MFTAAFSAISTLEEMVKAVDTIIEGSFNIDYSRLYLYNLSEKRLRLFLAKGVPRDEFFDEDKTSMEPNPGLVFRSGEMIYIPDILLEDKQLTKLNKQNLLFRSQLYLPLMNGNQAIGALEIVNSKPNAYNEEDIATLSFICNLAGVLYSNILNQNELKKLALIAKETENSVIITNKVGDIEWVNQAFTQMTGYQLDEVSGKKPGSFLQGPDTDPKTVALLSEAIKSEKSIEADIINYSKLNRRYWLKSEIQPIFDSAGNLENFISIQKEITKEKEQFDALQIANLRFQSLISSMQAGIMVEDEHRKVVLVNQFFCNIFSITVSPKQLIGMDCEEAAQASKVLFDDPEVFISDIYSTLDLGQVVSNHELHMSNGKTLERDFIPIENAENKNQGILWIYRNITERKKGERDLQRQSEILSGTSMAMNYLLTIPDHEQAMQKALEAVGIATGVDRAYIFENNIDKISGETFLSQRFEWVAEGVIPQIDNSDLQNMQLSKNFPRWYKLLSEGKTLSGFVEDFPDNERQLLSPQDIISLIVVPVFVNDQFWGTVGFDDCSKGIKWSSNEASILTALAASIGGSISREIIGKELSNARQIAEKATKTKSDFLATMSHEIRTPMNGVIGMTSLLLQTQLTPDQRDYADTIKISGELLLDLINDILDFSKIESGKMVLEEHSFDLRMAIEDVLDLVATATSQKKLGLYFQVDSAIPKRITGDLTRLRQILVNLVGNAIKFTPTGEIVIRVKPTALEGNEAILEFSVKDTGVGIPAEKIDRLFKPFSQVDASTTRKYGGTGLGLAISSKLVKLMNGNIWAKSEPGQGSEFLFTITTNYQAEKENPDYSPLPEIMRGKKMLIIDSNFTESSILSSLFKGMGMISLIAGSAEDALRTINETKDIDIVLIDDELKNLSSNFLTNEIKKINGFADVPLILITFPTLVGNGSYGNNNFNAKINKPLKQSQLISFVIKLLADNKNKKIQSNMELRQLQKINEIYPLNILVAEDNTINQKLILRLFEMLGYNINIAANGYEVIEALNRLKIDIIFMDIQMPEMDGLEATRQIVSLWGDRKPLIVAMTANALKNDRNICLEAGMDDYISKPLTINQVGTGIEKWAKMLKIGGK